MQDEHVDVDASEGVVARDDGRPFGDAQACRGEVGGQRGLGPEAFAGAGEMGRKGAVPVAALEEEGAGEEGRNGSIDGGAGCISEPGDAAG
ncbi:hypothetical protein UG55_10817 [Frankia sp. EI5c]|nr:hypothetical protein UG55_10817 [Frankia sp. EI5c]